MTHHVGQRLLHDPVRGEPDVGRYGTLVPAAPHHDAHPRVSGGGRQPFAPVCALAGLGLGVLLRHTGATVVTAVFTLLMLPTMFSESARWSADVNHAMVPAAWKRLVQNWEADPGSLGHTATVPGSWIVYALWPLTAVALAVIVVRRRDV
ncbi:hypothetical protein [Streptomyces erythrochromogenes]|uniref:hypothetical protein n=1 Tax=Streptomyces erythrochromogenes TaxID=285574 RepID=UPI00381EFC9B